MNTMAKYIIIHKEAVCFPALCPLLLCTPEKENPGAGDSREELRGPWKCLGSAEYLRSHRADGRAGFLPTFSAKRSQMLQLNPGN